MSLTHELVFGGPGPQTHDFHLRDRDVTLIVEAANRTYRLLHLHNVRSDTVAAARIAVDNFLDKAEPDSAHRSREEYPVIKNFDKVRQDLREYVKEARFGVNELRGELKDINKASSMRESRKYLDNNPLAAVKAACDEFLEKLKLIDDSDDLPKTTATTMNSFGDDSHKEIYQHMRTQAEQRGLIFEWHDCIYPNKPSSLVRYDIYFQESGELGSNYG